MSRNSQNHAKIMTFIMNSSAILCKFFFKWMRNFVQTLFSIDRKWCEISCKKSFRAKTRKRTCCFVEILTRTVSVISSDPPCKDSNVQFTTAPLKPLSDKKCGRYCRLNDLKKPQKKVSSLNKQKPAPAI